MESCPNRSIIKPRLAVRLVVIALFVANLNGCRQAASFESPNDAIANSLEQMSASAKFYPIDLDSRAVSILYPDKIIRTSETADAPIFLSGSFGVDIRGDSLYIADARYNKVIVANIDDNVFSREFGREGSAPGEFRALRRIFVNQKHFIALDMPLSSLSVFDSDFEYIDAVQIGPQYYLGFDLSTKYLVTSSTLKNVNLLTVREGLAPFRLVGSILSRLDENEVRPFSHNLPVVGVNNSGLIAAGYFGIPYLFLFDADLKLNQVIEFTGDYVHGLSNVENDSFGNPKTDSFFISLTVTRPGNIFFATGDLLYMLQKKEGGYVLKCKGELRDPSFVNETDREGILSAFGISVTEDDRYLFVVSMGRSNVYRFALDDLECLS